MNKIEEYKQKLSDYNKSVLELGDKISELQVSKRDIIINFGKVRNDFLNSLDLNNEDEFNACLENVNIHNIHLKLNEFVSQKCFPFVFNGVKNPIKLDCEQHLNYLRDCNDIKAKLEYMLKLIKPENFEIEFDSNEQLYCSIKFKNPKKPTELEFHCCYGGIELYMDIDKIDSKMFYYHVKELYHQQFDEV